jgi:hypothetical protein
MKKRNHTSNATKKPTPRSYATHTGSATTHLTSAKPFSRSQANKRHKITTKIVQRAAKRAAKNGQQALAEALRQLQEKLKNCRPGARCGSLACPRCARAFQKAKVGAQEEIITSLSRKRAKKKLVFVTIIPKRFTFLPDELHKIDVRKANRWFKDVIKAGGKRTIIGSVDLEQIPMDFTHSLRA